MPNKNKKQNKREKERGHTDKPVPEQKRLNALRMNQLA
jgi:hypothetical protein